MSVCFSTRSCPSEVRERRERIRRKNVSLSLKKTLSLSLSLSLQQSFSFFDMFYRLSIRFFFLSFALLFVLGVNSKRWSSLSFSLVFGEIGNHIIRLSLSLSLSVKKRAFWKTRSPLRILRSTQKERGIISEKEE